MRHALRLPLGQGEPPVSAAERDRTYKKDKDWAGVFGLLAVLRFGGGGGSTTHEQAALRQCYG
ncbi:hypothetical protein [Inhella crocodyli]|uniref:Uncharacterized protein n=1 Tax=Inhella crocodyli TaxID=2499851 RepID=A0A3S2UBS4_9BURK|nr:hypothetical protein [Inhella crocodyli]RVT83816.1 hypothetical protein EOD73_14725 [Inhella crocodyli]